MNAIAINNVSLPVLQIDDQRVVTLSMVDKVHQRPDGTASRNFREHRQRFIEAEDYFELTADEIRRQSFGHVFPPRTPKGIVLTESGYLMLVKSFTDDLAWDVQRKLVNSYFKVNQPDPLALLSNPEKLRAALLDYSTKVIELNAQIEEQAPKVAFANQVEAAPDAISVSKAAKLLGTGQRRLFSLLREIGWITRRNEPYQAKIEAGFMDVKLGSWEHPDHGLQQAVTPLITGKGLTKLQSVMGERKQEALL
jgi:phage antirepressor YoqD-like protein